MNCIEIFDIDCDNVCINKDYIVAVDERDDAEFDEKLTCIVTVKGYVYTKEPYESVKNKIFG